MIVVFFGVILLVDLGVEVIKIEFLGKGDMFWIVGFWKGIEFLRWFGFVCNKKFVMLDIWLEEGVEIFKKLISGVDILIENFCLGILEKWNLGYEEFKKVNFKLVMVCVLGYG